MREGGCFALSLNCGGWSYNRKAAHACHLTVKCLEGSAPPHTRWLQVQ